MGHVLTFLDLAMLAWASFRAVNWISSRLGLFGAVGAGVETIGRAS